MATSDTIGRTDKPMSDKNLPTGADPVSRWYREKPGATAVIENDVAYSYATLAMNTVQAATILASAGLRPGMVVGIECDVRYLHLVLILACEMLGAAHLAMVASDLAPDSDLPRRCDLLCVQSSADHDFAHPRIVRLSPALVNELLKIPVAAHDIDMLRRVHPADDLVRIGRSSGTTGRHKFMGYSRASLRNIVNFIPCLLNYDDTRHNFVCVSPFSQMGTYTDSLLALRSGGTVIYGTGQSFADDIRKFPGCHTSLVVRFAAELLDLEPMRHGRVDSCSIRLVGGFVPRRLLAALRETVTTEVLAVYSTNETSFISIHDDNGQGTLLPDVSVRIVDDAGRDLPPGEPGNILLRTTRMTSGYLWDAAQNARQFAVGWFRPNDNGLMPEPGRLIVLGRTDDLLNLGGIKFAPEPIEKQIGALDGVTDAVLIGLDNPCGTGELHIFVERGDPDRDRVVETSITALLIGYVTSYRVHYLTRLPRNATGKVRRDLLRRSADGSASRQDWLSA